MAGDSMENGYRHFLRTKLIAKLRLPVRVEPVAKARRSEHQEFVVVRIEKGHADVYEEVMRVVNENQVVHVTRIIKSVRHVCVYLRY